MIPLLIIFTSHFINNQFPKISVTSWTSSDSYTFDTTTPIPTTFFLTDTTLVIPSTVGGLILSCNASYPIEWNIHHEQLQTKRNGRSRSISLISTIRKSDDIFKPATFVYVSELTLLGDSPSLTGNYTCQSAAEDEEQIATSIYVFWEGTSPPFLVYAGENRTTIYDNNSDTAKVVLPCKVSRPDIQVTLFKNVDNNWVKFFDHQDITTGLYNPVVGFTLNYSNLSNLNSTLFGQYKCIANEEGDKDFVIINVVTKDMAPKPYEFKNFIRRPASFSFNTNQSQFICCSNNDRNPPKIMHFYCDHPITCKLKKNALAEMENTGKRTKDGVCSLISLRVKASGVLRCVGSGIDIVREYFFPMGFQWEFRYWLPQNVTPPYYSWELADPDKMLALATPFSQMYVGQNVSINCQISKYYFSGGARWMISWKNGTSLVVPEVLKNQSISRSRYRQLFQQNIISIIIVPEAEMSSITCFAPVWNTSDWKNKSLPLHIEVPILPEIDGEKVEVIEWYVNETNKEISCHSIGKPIPRIVWRRDNENTTLNMRITTSNGSSTISIPRVSYEHHGVYICKSTNLAGANTKSFQVIVYERTSSGTIAAIVISILVIIIMVIAVTILILRLRAQKATINQLAIAAFKDFENPNHQIIPRDNYDDTSQVLADLKKADLNIVADLKVETGNYNRLS